MLQRLAATQMPLANSVTILRLVLQTLSAQRRVKLQAGSAYHATERLCTGSFSELEDWKDISSRHLSMWPSFVTAWGDDLPCTKAQFVNLLCAIDCNSFLIWSHNRKKRLGVGLYVDSSLFNHSCAPNVARVQRGINADFYTLRPVEPGESLCIAYVDPRLDQGARCAECLSHYAFQCACTRCNGDAVAPAMCQWHLGYMIPKDGRQWCSVCSPPPVSEMVSSKDESWDIFN